MADRDVEAFLVPDETDKSVSVRVEDCRLTEMGIRFDIRSKVANMVIEIDLDQDPDYFLGLLQVIPDIIDDQMQKMGFFGGDDDAPEHPAVQQGPVQ